MMQRLGPVLRLGLVLLLPLLISTALTAASSRELLELKPVLMAGPTVQGDALFSAISLQEFKWLSFGLALGISGILAACLIWNSSALKTSVCIGHLVFVGMAVACLTLAIFGESLRSFVGPLDLVLLGMVRFQFVLSSIMVYSLLTQALSRELIGTLFSALIGGVIATSVIQFFWPVDLFLLLNEALLVTACLYLCGKQYISQSSKTLFFQLLIIITMVFILVWIPDLKKLSGDSYILFAALQIVMLSGIAGSLWSALGEHTTNQFGRMKREIYISESKLAKQKQTVQLLQFDRLSMERQLAEEVELRQFELTRESMKFKGLEEMSQDIAIGVSSYLKELNYLCHSLLNECRSPKVRLQKIRTCADRATLLASKAEVVMSILQRHESGQLGKLINGSDLLKECLRICHDKIVRNGVELEIDSYEKELWLEGRLSQLAQGFLGLLYNALEATEASDVRRITIRLRRLPRAEQDPGRAWVEFSISNSGPGIPTAIKSKVFYAKNREGLGAHSLGLSMAFGVFECFGGSLSLDHEAVATTFVAKLPLYDRGQERGIHLAG